jgi:hypothetical protein
MMRHVFYAVLLILAGNPDLSRASWITPSCMDDSVAGFEGPFNEPVSECRCVCMRAFMYVWVRVLLGLRSL